MSDVSVSILARLKSAHYSASSVLIFVLYSYMNLNNYLNMYNCTYILMICLVFRPFQDTNNILLKGTFTFYFNLQKISGNIISVSV